MTVLERTHFFPRQIVTADDLTQDQEYFREKLRRHNRFLHGWGVVCGLEVTPDPIQLAPWRIQIGAGYALDPWGNDIHVAEPIQLNLAVFGPGAETDPCALSAIRIKKPIQGLTAPSQLYLVIQYAECNTSPVRVMTNGCGSGDNACEYSRQRDSFQIKCLSDLPESHQTRSGLSPYQIIFTGAIPPYISPAPDPNVLLARITLPARSPTHIDPVRQIGRNNIDMALRRQIYDAAILQAQLIAMLPRAVTVLSGGGVLEDSRVQEAILTAVGWESSIAVVFPEQEIRLLAELEGKKIDILSNPDISYDPEKSKTLLAIAGYDSFAASMLVANADKRLLEFAKRMAEDLSQINISLTLEQVAGDIGERFSSQASIGMATLALY